MEAVENSANLNAILSQCGDLFFEKLAELFNFVFSYRVDGYQPVNAEWVAENIPVRAFKEIGEELAEQNNLGSALPFLRGQLATILEQNFHEATVELSENGKPTT